MTRPAILDMDVVVVPREANATMWTEAAAPLERWRKETFFGSKNDAAVLSYRAAISASPYLSAWDDVRKYVEGLERSNEMWRRNSIDTKAAMTAMRNDINQHVPLPSLDSDLLQGPENSVFCATVASAVAARIAELEAELASLAELYGDEEKPRYTTRRLRMEVERAKAAAGIRIAELEKRLADAERVIEPFAAVDPMNVWHETEDDAGYYVLTENQFRAARAYMEGK